MRKMSSLWLFSICIFLFSCTSNRSSFLPCEEITISRRYNVSFKHSVSFAYVFEYENKEGDSIYTSCKTTYERRDFYTGEVLPVCFCVYADPYVKTYDEYYFVRFVGYLKKEINYYLDVEQNLIEERTVYSRCSPGDSPIEGAYSEFDNNEAYKKARKSYYKLTSEKDSSIVVSTAMTGLTSSIFMLVPYDAIVTYILRD